MFGLTVKERLLNGICSSCANNIEMYKIEVYEYCKKYVDSEPPEDEILEIRKRYLNSVLNEVFELVGASSSNISSRLSLVLMSPEMSGYPSSNFENGVMAGAVYAFCYWAIKNKQADIADCFALNHLQDKIMNDALVEVSEQFE